jgi:hypothetical protein
MARPAAFAFFYNKKTMKQLITLLGLLWCLGVAAQNDDMKQLSKDLDKSMAELKKQMAQSDSLRKASEEMMARHHDSMQTVQIKREAERSGQMMLQLHNERVAQQKRKMFIYLGLGVFFLGILVFRLIRMRKKKN